MPLEPRSPGIAPAKDPVKVAAGRAGMIARHGVPRVIRLDGFNGDERAAIIAAIEARRAAKDAREAREAGS